MDGISKNLFVSCTSALVVFCLLFFTSFLSEVNAACQPYNLISSLAFLGHLLLFYSFNLQSIIIDTLYLSNLVNSFCFIFGFD